MKTKLWLFSLLVSSLVGCAGGGAAQLAPPIPETAYTQSLNSNFALIERKTSVVEKDKAAILAMQGDYRVDFNFQETVALQAGYELHDDKNTGGFETVLVIENEPNRIVLQHILVAENGHVIKHWRQDWYYEAKARFEFVADQQWAMRAIDTSKIDGMWTQCVFEVSDAPRYCGTGKWNHRYGVSTWTSDRTWRPLPRREYTKRDDYNAINAENRHTITANGWTHEQDNTKTLREGRETKATLVREFGFNDYRNITGYNFEPAKQYWRKTSTYWSKVRNAWEQRISTAASLELTTDVDGMPIITGTFKQAEQASEETELSQLQAIEQLLSEWTVVR